MQTNLKTAQMDVAAYMRELGLRARAASRKMAAANTGQKNAALVAISDVLLASRARLLEAHNLDNGCWA